MRASGKKQIPRCALDDKGLLIPWVFSFAECRNSRVRQSACARKALNPPFGFVIMVQQLAKNIRPEK